MKEILKRLAPLIDVAVVPAVLVSAFILKQLRRAGVARMPLSRAALDLVGVLPVRDHYYEPLVVPPASLAAQLSQDRALPGVDMNVAAQLALLRKLRFADELAEFPRRKVREAEFYYDNDAFAAGDAEYFYGILRHFRPRQLIEVGSGFSTLLARAALARNRALDPAYAFRHICIEPYEMPWLECIDGLEVRRQRVEEIDISLFESLGENDILFIDSSHVIRPRGDVLFEYLEVLPRLQPGVLVHVHDIFTPKDYLARWVVEERRLWNEQYLLEAFLSCNERFEVVAALNYLAHHHPDELAAAAPVFGATRQHSEPGVVLDKKALSVAPVSVVVPCFQCKATIQRAVASIEAQSVRPREIILVDDASGDGTLEALREVQQRLGADRVKVIALERNLGAGEARNAGWDAATGEYVAFLDADDAWHPAKLEIQYAFMRDHPEFAASGHAHGVVRAPRAPDADLPDEGFKSIGRRELLLSNRFITPSAMVRRELQFRFRRGKRYMEDHALWLDLVVAGLPVARLNACLAYIFKAPFGEAGLSARVLAMECGELAMYRDLWRERGISLAAFVALALFSGMKFLRRVLLWMFRPREAGFSWLYPAGYLSVTHSIPALLVVMGLAGRSELAAEIAVIAGATIATFHAFSANTRSLILARSAVISVREILASRLLLVLPLGLLAVLLATIPAGIPAGLAVVLVLRRAVEWFNEVHLCDAELQANRGFVRAFLGLQAGLFVATAALLGSGSALAIPVAYLWALAPLAVSLPFMARTLRGPGRGLAGLMPSLLPHIGSTAMMGLSIYAFRLLILLFAEKATAGDLFVAIAIGSFMGTIFANVLGPSFLLEQNRTGDASLPLSMRLALALTLAAGLCVAAFATPLALSVAGLGKAPFFWLATGLSLVGGVAMVAAQRVRLRILAYDDGRDLFGPDVLTHVLLIAAIPFVVGLWGAQALAGIYLCNAVLAFALYKTAEIAHRRGAASTAERDRIDSVRAAIAFAVFFPVFFQLSGTIYHVAKPMFDSGGVLSSVPLPLSIAACFAGVVALGDYRRATLGYAFVFALFAVMLISILVTPASVVVEEKRKFLLLMQCLLPAFGMVVAMQAATPASSPATIERAIGAAVAVIVPLQLLSTWLHGELALRHDVWLFSVYQHWQYVPVIVCAAYLVALSRLWSDPGIGRVLKAGAPLVAIYVFAAVSTVSVVLLMLGLVLVAALWILRTRRWGHALPAGLAAIAIVGYALAFGDDSPFALKYPRLAAGNMAARAPCSGLQLARVSREISAKDAACEIRAGKPSTWNWLLISRPYSGTTSHALIVEGELREGALRIGFLQFGVWHTYQDLHVPGAFKLVMPIPAELATDGSFVEAALNHYAPGTHREVLASITRFTIEQQAGAAKPPQPPSGMVADANSGRPSESRLPLNFVLRFDDWRLFGKPILDSPKTFLFGHDRPVDRSIRTSAHNYYLDVAYLFGVAALLPVLGLVVFTLVAAWRRRGSIAADPALLVLLAVVLYLVLVDSNFKVTLRQPYPGIATFFLWGLLLSRLSGVAGDRPDER